MDNQASMYSEKKLAYFETVYKESKLSKPQEVNITVTANHIYGVAFIWEQQGIKEEDPVYKRFACGLEEITKIYVNNNNKMNPLYIQCDDTSKNVINRKRIILPSFDDNDAIKKVIEEAKVEVDEKLEKQREKEKAIKIKELEARRKAMDDEFESMTSDYKAMIKPAKVESAPIVERTPKAEPKPAPAPTPKAEPKPAPAPAPKVEEKSETDFVEDILGLDSILGIKHDNKAENVVMEVVEDVPNEAEINAIPEEVVQKDPDEIETVEVPEAVPTEEPEKEKPEDNIETIDTAAEMAKKLTPKSALKRVASHNKEEKREVQPVPKREINVLPDKAIDHMTLDDFETAVKKLKAMFDNGMISDSQFAEEKKKLLKHLY